jgi:predicted dehydrogenase
VVLALGDRQPSDAEADALADHLRAGGGVVFLGETLAVWCRHRVLAALIGWEPGELMPRTQLRVRPAPRSPISPRLDAELLLNDRAQLGVPRDDVEPLVLVPWRFEDRVVGFRQRASAGRLVQLGLGVEPAVFADPAYHRLVHRCILAAAGLDAVPPIGVGLYGYGAIGREHAESVRSVEGLELRGVCDRSRARLEDATARFDVRTHVDSRDLLADPSVELVVVGVPPTYHASAVLECLAASRHVVCEKPFTLRADEADRVLEAAAAARRTVTVYQSRRWDPDFVTMRDAVRRGEVGEPFYAEAFIGGFGHPCSYWHSHEAISGGTIFDWGSHYFDWLLQLLPGRVVRVTAQAHKRLWHDVTNADQVRVDLTFEGGEQAVFLQSDIAAAAKPKWYLLGTGGAIVGDWRLEAVTSRAWTGDLIEERLEPSESPAVVRVHRPNGSGGTSVTELGLPSREPLGFYRNLADHLLLGEPLAVPAEEARRNVAVMEAAARSAAADGRPVEISA